MRTFDRVLSILIVAILGSACDTGQGPSGTPIPPDSPPTDNPATPGTAMARPELHRGQVLSEFVGLADPATGELRISPVGIQAWSEAAVVQNGTAGTGPANTVELVTEGTGSHMTGCGVDNSFCGNVRVRSFYGVTLTNVYVELDSINPITGHDGLNSSPPPDGLSATYGLWSYGNLGALGSGTNNAIRQWIFGNTDESSFTFHGRVVYAPTCGDSYVSPGETCDDGDAQSGDGCSSACAVEPGYSCPTPGQACVASGCGDGAVAVGSEQCDDGNTSGSPVDGCSSTCTIDSGWTCAGSPSNCSVCGNSSVGGTEECDDGDGGGDGCAADCTVEANWACSGSPSVCYECGDAIRNGDEECDDGNNLPNDGCSAACAVEDGYSCSENGEGLSTCTTLGCGDGIVAVGTEGCDDGNTSGSPVDGCSPDCTVVPGWTCAGSPSDCSVCGDGSVGGEEQCDDADDTDPLDGCHACVRAAGYTCPTEGEPCVTVCGDGLLLGTEACDDGDAASGDGCSASCAEETGWTCTDASPSVCTAVSCGDGVVAGTETCDDGDDTDPLDGCDGCAVAAGWACVGSPSTCYLCGNGTVDIATETCDDGNRNSGDGCSATCAVEPGYTCGGDPYACTTSCGDGIIGGLETCDDGDSDPLDGCSITCTLEDGWSCFGAPSQCSLCGDGVIGGAETCDDGNSDPDDGCSGACAVEAGWTCGGSPSVCSTICGDGLVEGAEACDDGDTSSGDGCSATCTVESGYTCAGAPSDCSECGDGTLGGTEACDDGDAVAGDGCSDLCVVETGWTCTQASPSVCTLDCVLVNADPGFEGSGWSVYDAAIFADWADHDATGGLASEGDGDRGVALQGWLSPWRGGVYQSITSAWVIPGQTYSFGAWFHIEPEFDDATLSLTLELEWFDSVGGYISETTVDLASGTLPTGTDATNPAEWNRYWVSGVAPTGAAQVLAAVRYSGAVDNGGAQAARVDDARVYGGTVSACSALP